MSNEVRYELESGLHKALVERKIKIILIELTPVSDFTLLPQSLSLLKSHRVLRWKPEESLSYNSRFWKNLLYLMPAKTVKPCGDELEVLPALSQSWCSEKRSVRKNSRRWGLSVWVRLSQRGLFTHVTLLCENPAHSLKMDLLVRLPGIRLNIELWSCAPKRPWNLKEMDLLFRLLP